MAGYKGQNKGNKNAVGNSGGQAWSKKNRSKAATLKGLILDRAIKKLRSKTVSEKEKDEIMLRGLTASLPQDLDVGGQGDNPMTVLVKFLDGKNDNNRNPQ